MNVPASELDPVLARIESNPKYQLLKRRRNTLGWTLTVLMLIAYYGYVGLIAFDKEFLARPIGAGVTSLGIPIGMGVIVFTIAITIYYVRIANNRFDALTVEILKDVTK